ncbi:hypothetical protein [Streptomyces sp. NPDC087294]|uniref:hypothetical protein n=1 Tax=Streptomyces sp. NPDC087294 TaxID=3365777 RepID=UPI00381F153A
MTWTYECDAAGDLFSETDFDSRTLTYWGGVGAAGRLAARVGTLGKTIRLARDQFGQVVRRDVDGRVTTYVYDRAGCLVEAVGPDSGSDTSTADWGKSRPDWCVDIPAPTPSASRGVGWRADLALNQATLPLAPRQPLLRCPCPDRLLRALTPNHRQASNRT